MKIKNKDTVSFIYALEDYLLNNIEDMDYQHLRNLFQPIFKWIRSDKKLWRLTRNLETLKSLLKLEMIRHTANNENIRRYVSNLEWVEAYGVSYEDIFDRAIIWYWWHPSPWVLFWSTKCELKKFYIPSFYKVEWGIYVRWDIKNTY